MAADESQKKKWIDEASKEGKLEPKFSEKKADLYSEATL